jgi:hypothetical protein
MQQRLAPPHLNSAIVPEPLLHSKVNRFLSEQKSLDSCWLRNTCSSELFRAHVSVMHRSRMLACATDLQFDRWRPAQVGLKERDKFAEADSCLRGGSVRGFSQGDYDK